MKKLWLIFAQTVAIAVGIFVVLAAFAPDRVSWPNKVVRVTETAARSAQAPVGPVSSYSAPARKAIPSVVNIYSSKRVQRPRPPLFEDPLFRRYYGLPEDADPERATGLGSGVIVGTDGYILTNNHVVAGADEIAVSLRGGRAGPARLVGADPESDLAVLKTELKDLAPITFGDSDRIDVGDVVLAIGNPFGVGQTVTQGIVSATGRNRLGINTFENFIQTDAAVNPGNSGGALIDVRGDLIGINTAIYSETGGSLGIGFAIPVNLAKQVMQQLLTSGRVERGWIGVQVDEITPELAQALKLSLTSGVVVAGVFRGGPAAQAGVKPGDVVKTINSKAIADAAAMINETTALAPGSKADFALLRDGKELHVTVSIARRPPPEKEKMSWHPLKRGAGAVRPISI